jgi:WD40 repeat protein
MSKGTSKDAHPRLWLASALGMGLLALISYTQATGPRRPAPDALAANQPAAARDGQTLAAVSPDGRQLASVAADGRIELRGLAKGDMPRDPLEQPGAAATGLAYSLDGKWLAALLNTGQIGLFDTATGQALKVLDAPAGTAGLLAFSPDSRWLASGGQAGPIALWETASGEARGVLDGTSAVLGLAFSGDSARLVSANAEGQAVVWDLALGVETAVLDGLAAVPEGLDLGGSGKALLLAAITRAGQAELWDLAPGHPPAQRPGFLQGQEDQHFRAVAFSPDSKRLAGLAGSGTAYLWEAATGAVQRTLAAPGNARQSLLSFAPDGTALAIADDQGGIRVWDAQTGQLRAGPLQAGGPVAALGYGPDGKTLISRNESGQVTAWTLPAGVPRFVAQAPAPGPVPAPASAADATPAPEPARPKASPQAAARAAAPSSAKEPAKDPAASFDAASAKPHWRGIKALAVDPANRWVAAGGDGGQLRILGADGQPRFTLDGHHHQDVAGVAFTADSSRMVSIGRDTTVQVWNVATGQQERALDGLEHPPRALAVSSRDQIAGAGEETRIVIWDGASGQMKQVLRGHKDFVNGLDFSPDGAKLASGGEDRSLIVWDLGSGQPLLALPCQAEINAVKFSPDGKQVAAATAAGTVLVWDAAQGGSPLVLQGHGGPVRGLAFSHDGQQLATAGADAKTLVWEPHSGKLLKAMTGSRPVNALSFGQGGQLFEVGEDAQDLEEWNADTGGKLHSVPLDGAGVPPHSAAEPAGAWAGLLGRALDWLVPPAAAAIPAAPTGPILVLTAGASNFGNYYAEILRAEGLNAFDVADLSTLNLAGLQAALDAHDLVLLAPAALGAGQATVFSDWVGAGGNLIAVRPDAQLAGLLGLAATGQAALKDAYLLVDNSRLPGNGIGASGQPMQFHGSADRYTLNGAASLANLYSGYAVPTANPALSLRTNIGTGANRGRAAAFTYDLAASIVYTRQGNPAWIGQERDGLSPIRSDDKFFGNAVTPPLVDPQPDWVDLGHLAGVPQADEQQRLLANLIGFMNLGKKPLPRLWYLPFDKKAAVIMTGDDHAQGGTIGRFDQFKAASPAGCNLANWECVRGTSYVFPNTPMVDAQGRAVDYKAYRDLGFEIGLHVNTNCGNYDLGSLRSFYNDQLARFATNFPGLTPKTQRHHCIAWSGWAIGAVVQAENGIRLDTSYYFWPPGWVQDRPGYFNGSALPMRFADTDGTLLDNYLAVSHMTDESGQSYPYTIAALLDKAVGPEGYFGAYTLNAHTDLVDSPEAGATVAAAQARGVPVVSAQQMLEWLDGRERSWFKNLAWTGSQLSFSIGPAPGSALPNGLRAMVPLYAANGAKLSGLVRGAGGASVAYTPWPVKGVEYALFPAAADNYTATYAANASVPVVDSVSPAAGAGDAKTASTVTATFKEAIDPASVTANSFLLADPSGALVEASVSYVAATRTAVLTPKAALATLSGYTATLKGGTAADRIQAGHALPADYAWSFAVQPPCTATPCTVWPASAVPGTASSLDTGAVEVGVKFKSDIDGYIQGIRFYKGANNSGVHVGNLWSATGTRLATATFSNESGSGWQQVNFASPVPVTANTTYVASYYAPNGHYAADNSYFSVGRDNAPLRLPSSTAAGGNGVYAYGASSAFPDKSYQATNYWVDVAFINSAPFAISTASSLPGGTVGTAYASSLQASGGIAPYSWSAVGGALPPGITLGAGGALAGTPQMAGNYTFTAQATDAASPANTLSKAFSLSVQAAIAPPSITTTALPGATAGTAYTATLTATGGTAPLAWSVSAGSLPAGLTLNASSGAISGTPTTAGSSSFTAQVTDASNRSATANLGITVSASATTVSLFGSATPASADGGADNPVELGMRFTSSGAGQATGVRFYKSTANTGAHVGSLWSSTGTLLAQATFSGETASGWQQVNFASPVSLVAGTTYVVSYHAMNGHYAADLNGFQAGRSNPPLSAPASAGVYAYGANSAFPSLVWNKTNYWVDVLFAP